MGVADGPENVLVWGGKHRSIGLECGLVVDRGRRSRGELGRGSEFFALQDEMPQFRDGNAMGRIPLKYSLKDGLELLGDGQDRAKKTWIFQESPEGGILTRSTFPWIAATGEVHQNDAKAPHIVRRRSVERL